MDNPPREIVSKKVSILFLFINIWLLKPSWPAVVCFLCFAVNGVEKNKCSTWRRLLRFLGDKDRHDDMNTRRKKWIMFHINLIFHTPSLPSPGEFQTLLHVILKTYATHSITDLSSLCACRRRQETTKLMRHILNLHKPPKHFTEDCSNHRCHSRGV